MSQICFRQNGCVKEIITPEGQQGVWRLSRNMRNVANNCIKYWVNWCNDIMLLLFCLCIHLFFDDTCGYALMMVLFVTPKILRVLISDCSLCHRVTHKFSSSSFTPGADYADTVRVTTTQSSAS